MFQARQARVNNLPEAEFSYTSPDDPPLKRLLVQAIERMTGQPHLKRLYLQNQSNPRPDESFWDAAVRQLGLSIQCHKPDHGIPASGPVVVVSNHPFGVLDGIVLSWLASRHRSDFKVVAHSLLYRAPELKSHIYPIDFSETADALKANVRTRRDADAWLARGGMVLIFPGGGVATARTLLGPAEDLPWGTYAARLIMRHRATVVPVFFPGQNSRLFQISSKLSQTLREALLFREVYRRMNTTVVLRVGESIPFSALEHLRKRQDLIDHIRDITFSLDSDSPQRLAQAPDRIVRRPHQYD